MKQLEYRFEFIDFYNDVEFWLNMPSVYCFYVRISFYNNMKDKPFEFYDI